MKYYVAIMPGKSINIYLEEKGKNLDLETVLSEMEVINGLKYIGVYNNCDEIKSVILNNMHKYIAVHTEEGMLIEHEFYEFHKQYSDLM